MREDRDAQCPNCDADCESEDHDSDFNYRDEVNNEWWSFTCPECGCEFTITETEVCTTTTETEITKEGKNKTH